MKNKYQIKGNVNIDKMDLMLKNRYTRRQKAQKVFDDLKVGDRITLKHKLTYSHLIKQGKVIHKDKHKFTIQSDKGIKETFLYNALIDESVEVLESNGSVEYKLFKDGE
jgi:preprotein translocase subunit YajC